MFVCICKAVREKDILNAVVERGINNFDDLQAYTQAATGCGICESFAKDILDKAQAITAKRSVA